MSRHVTGWVNFDKPYAMGSTPAVGFVRRLFQADKAGHAGTLDPLATGILPIALGEATKTVSFMQAAVKVYEVTAHWGAATHTDDGEGAVSATSAHRPSAQEIADILPQFCGDILQVPPAFSAIRHNGERAYAAARRGETVELTPRQVRIDKLELLVAETDTAQLRVTCGKGVYIRALVRDLAVALGTFGHVASLRRTQVGSFSEKNTIGLEKLQTLGHSAPDLAALDACLLPLATALDDIPALAVSDTQASRLKQGQAISANLSRGVDAAAMLATCDNVPVAICQNLEAGAKIRPVRVFNLVSGHVSGHVA